MLIPAKLYIDNVYYDTKVDDSVKDFFVRKKSLAEELYRDRATSKTMTTVKKIDVLDTDKVINKNISLFFDESEIKMYSVNFKKNLSNDIHIYYDFFIFRKNVRYDKLKKILL